MRYGSSSRASDTFVAGAAAGVGVSPVVSHGAVFYKHQSAHTTERVDANGQTSKVESVR